jgi:hypothetical protein
MIRLIPGTPRENAMQASSGSSGAGGESAQATWLGEKLA